MTYNKAEFYEQIVNFRNKMGTKMKEENYHAIFRAITIMYLNTKCEDNESEEVAMHFQNAQEEYVTRMSMMGLSI